ncbi:efflux RND transporter periplasmic adaptor subunit [Litorilituus lipolyticus]|uniref:Efflux RND transporter periplasmic adaptor subunit n=1 Tax=Litorilituus lipolyticus TaxID=2491017 RepID=A0A502KKM2_9GAMM|nr:efflux RND transporter periplasmic adaptor subunit [Litorilituus lipolyticus]TPH12118.1 efflux RND transporter periplasmic adaptor subunit [Litorilituus lipolyticus]
MKVFFTKGVLFLTTILSLHSYAATVAVEVIEPKQQIKKLEIELSGTVEALNDAQLTSLEAGTVKNIYVNAGEQVTAKQTLLTLDDSIAQIKLQQAQALFQSAQVKYQEDLRLYNEIIDLTEQEVMAKTLLEERRANAAVSKALLAQAAAEQALQQEIVNRHQVKAPFSGTIAQRGTDIGEWVTQQSKIFQLVSDDELRIFVDVPQEYFSEIKESAHVNALVIPDTAPQEKIALPLSQFIAVSNPLSRTFKARIDLPKNTSLIAGMSATVKLVLPNKTLAQVNLPKSALKRHPDGNYSVYGVVDNKVKRFGVNMIASSFNTVSVSGVPNGTPVIISGSDLLIDGTPVTIKKP